MSTSESDQEIVVGSRVEPRRVTVWSDGVPLAAELFLPQTADPQGAPGVVLCHGWGGLREHLSSTYAGWFARAGLACLTFDYRGWGDSPGIPVKDVDGTVRERKSVVGPKTEIEDIRAALNFMAGQPGVDSTRLALWGTSFGGGLALTVAAMDPRVRALVGQVGCYGVPRTAEFAAKADERAVQKARGDGPADIRTVLMGGELSEEQWTALNAEAQLIFNPGAAGGLLGLADLAEMHNYQPRDMAKDVHVPTLIVDAEHEEYYDRTEQGWAVYQAIAQNAPAEYETYPCAHYDVYKAPIYFEASTRQRDWLLRHLK